MRRFFLLVLVLSILMTHSAFAGGSSESNQHKEYENPFKDVEMPFEEQVVNTIADTLTSMTTSLAIAVTPFPNILVPYYVSKDVSRLSINNATLLSEGYFELGSPKQEVNIEDSDDAFTDIDISGTVYKGRSQAVQHNSFNMITVLFLAFFIAEIVFSTIYGYVVERDGGVLKNIIAKAVLTMMLFLLVSCIPFLIEAFRDGFQYMAKMLSGVSSIDSNTGNGENGLNSYALAQVELNEASIFEMPGLVMKSFGNIVSWMNPKEVGGTDLNIIKSTGNGKIMEFLLGLVYLILKVIGYIMTLFASLHVMLNIVEVYILMGMVMCLMPFTVFSPLKFLGEKAIMSLFGNLLELFVIMFIIYTTYPVGISLTDMLMSGISMRVKSANYVIFVEDERFATEKLGITTEQFDMLCQAETYMNSLDGVSSDRKGFSISIWFNEDGSYESELSSTLSDAVDGLWEWISSNFESNKNNTSASGVSENKIYSLDVFTKSSIASGNTPDRSSISFENLCTADKDEVFRKIIADTQLSYPGVFVKDVVKTEEMLSVEAAQSGEDNGLLVFHLFSSILAIFMITYFINQSSQITNALLTGNVSSEGITAGLGKRFAAMAGGMAMKSTVGAAGRAAGGAVKGLGSMAGYHMASSAVSAQANGSTNVFTKAAGIIGAGQMQAARDSYEFKQNHSNPSGKTDDVGKG